MRTLRWLVAEAKDSHSGVPSGVQRADLDGRPMLVTEADQLPADLIGEATEVYSVTNEIGKLRPGYLDDGDAWYVCDLHNGRPWLVVAAANCREALGFTRFLQQQGWIAHMEPDSFHNSSDPLVMGRRCLWLRLMGLVSNCWGSVDECSDSTTAMRP